MAGSSFGTSVLLTTGYASSDSASHQQEPDA
jgi:hypothetical protein